MKTSFIVISPGDLKNFLLKENKRINSKDYEIVASLLLYKFHIIQTGAKCQIVFPVKDNVIREVSKSDPEYISKIIRQCIDEDTPVDVGIISDENESKKFGYFFQLKRHIMGSIEQNCTNGLIYYLNEIIPKKYSKTNVSLVLLLEFGKSNDGVIDLGKIRTGFNPIKFPFRQVLYVLGISKSKLVVGEFWPNFGRTEYTKQDILS